MLRQVRLPDYVTLFSLCLGILSMWCSFNHYYAVAILLVPLTVVLDGVDGMIAKAINRQGEFGKHLDLHGDLINFGLTLVVFWLNVSGRTVVDYLVVAFFVATHMIRLASLHFRPADEPNTGMPDTIVVTTISLSYFVGLLPFFPVLFVLGGILMVAPIRVPRLRLRWRNRHPIIMFD